MNTPERTEQFDTVIHYPMGNGVVAATLVNTETDRARQIRTGGDLLEFPQTAWLNQVHGGTVHLVENRRFKNGVDGDALVCRTPGILLGIFTADCVPVLLKGLDEVGVVHAGWRGFMTNIFAHFFECWQTRPDQTSALVGPCICTNCYEVGFEVADRFPPEERFHHAGKRPHLDLRLAARNRLLHAGVRPDRIRTIHRCTACSSELHSYREDRSPFRNLSLIGLTGRDG